MHLKKAKHFFDVENNIAFAFFNMECVSGPKRFDPDLDPTFYINADPNFA